MNFRMTSLKTYEVHEAFSLQHSRKGGHIQDQPFQQDRLKH